MRPVAGGTGVSEREGDNGCGCMWWYAGERWSGGLCVRVPMAVPDGVLVGSWGSVSWGGEWGAYLARRSSCLHANSSREFTSTGSLSITGRDIDITDDSMISAPY